MLEALGLADDQDVLQMRWLGMWRSGQLIFSYGLGAAVGSECDDSSQGKAEEWQCE